MGLFSRLTQSSDSTDENGTADTVDGDGADSFDIARDGIVDPERRQRIIETNYHDVDSEDARLITETLQIHLQKPDELSKVEATRRIAGRTDLSRDRTAKLFWTERASAQHYDSVTECRESDVISGVSILGGDDCDPPVCADAQAEIAERGGSVSPDELKSILREHAQAHAEDGATPGRVDHWVPHHRCKAVIRTHVD